MHDVVIVGGGPVGLFLACELGLAGCSVLVLEREPEPGSPWRSFPLGMRGLSAGSVEAFYRRDLLHPLLAASGVAEVPGADEQAPPRSVGHFAGMALDPADVDLTRLPYRLPGPAMDGIMTTLDAVETVLAERAVKLGAEIRRGEPVSAVTQDDETVVVTAGDHEYPARWLVGCDGGRSTVRGLAGFEFAGTEPRLTGYLALATLADPGALRPGFTVTQTGMYLTMSGPGHLGVLDFDGGAYDRSRPVTREHLQTVLRRVSGTDVTLTDVHLASSFTDRAMQATTYRRGRVLLAGDAAHIHSPLGGQGLNLGIGDAVNLGWKLAATARGQAPDGLLDTYTAERHPVGARVLDWSRAQVAVMRPDPHSRAIQAVVRDLLATRDGTTYVFARTSGTSTRYDLGSDQPLIGHNAPDFRLADGTRLGELMHDGRGVAVDFSGRLRDVAAHRADRVRYVAGPARDDLGFGAVLVRPDGVVAWAGDRDPDRDSFDNAVTRWFRTIPVEGNTMDYRWIATWGTAQQLAPAVESGGGPEMPDEDADLPPAAPATVSAQTVRMVARSTVGGSAVRVALANSFGHAPVRVGAAFLAGPGGVARLTFGGRDTVTLPTGALIHSDPVDYEVPQQTDLVVSLYLPDDDVTPTVHQVGLRTAWLAPGDQAAEPDLRDATEFQSYLWLTGIDVLAPPEAATVIAIGDSLVDGMETTPGADAPWPSVLARRLAAHPGLPSRAVINMGIAGNRVLRETDGMGASVLARFDRDVLARPGARWVILLAGANDMFFGLMPGVPESERATAADIITGYRLLIARAHLHGLRVIGCTLPPVSGAPVFTPEFEAVHKQVNGWIRDSGEFDAVTDLDTALRDPAGMPPELLADDGVHPNDAGHAAIAEVFDLDLFRT